MKNCESIFIGNVKRFSNYSGYGWTLAFSSTFKGESKKDIIAIDAIPFGAHK